MKKIFISIKNRKSILLIISLLLISFIFSLVNIKDRNNIEKASNNIKLVIEYEEIEKKAEQSDEDINWWLEYYKSLGITDITIREETIKSFSDENINVNYYIFKDMSNDIILNNNIPELFLEEVNKNNINDYDLIIKTNDKEINNYLKDRLLFKYDESFYSFYDNEETYIIVLKGDEHQALYSDSITFRTNDNSSYSRDTNLVSSKLKYLNIGYDDEKVNNINNAGLNIIPRPNNYEYWSSEKSVNATLKEIESLGFNQNYLILGASEIIGYPNNMDIFIDYMNENNISLPLIETAVQRKHFEVEGMDAFIEATDYNVYRLFSTWPYIQQRFGYLNYSGPEEIVNTYYRAITERNIKLILFRPFKYDNFNYVLDTNYYDNFFIDLESRISRHGYTLGEPLAFEVSYNTIIKEILIGMSGFLIWILIILIFIRLNILLEYLLIFLGLIMTVLMSLYYPSNSDKIFSILIATGFASASILYLILRWKNYYLSKMKLSNIACFTLFIKDLIIMSFISLIGGLLIGGLMFNIEYLLEMDIFRGVKFSQMIPIIFFIIAFASIFPYKGDVEKGVKLKNFKSLLNEKIKVINILVLVIIGYIGYIYLARTGHESGVEALRIEMIFRNFLEENLLVRPRNKEFLFGFPILIFANHFILKKKILIPFILGVFIVIGQTSIINTFCHLRTPIYMSFYRVVYSIGFGIIVALLYFGIFKALKKVIKINFFKKIN